MCGRSSWRPGIALTYFTICCPVHWLIGPPLIILALIVMIWWARTCRITRCKLAAEVGIIVITMIIPAFAWAAQIPLVSACINPGVGLIVSLVAAWLGFVLSECASGSGTNGGTTPGGAAAASTTANALTARRER